MNRKSRLITLTMLLLTASWSFAGGPPCSAKSVAGDWGFTTTGLIILPTGPVPVALSGDSRRTPLAIRRVVKTEVWVANSPTKHSKAPV